MQTIEAIVLAGGLGTRLKSVVSDIPKPMATVAGKPFLEYVLRFLERNGIKRVVLAVGYKYEVIEEYFGANYKGIELVYSVESEPLGTGGAVKLAAKSIHGDAFFLINGDTFFKANLSELEEQLNKTGSNMVLSLKPMENFDRYGVVETVEDKIVGFSEKQYCKKGQINGGVYLLRSKLLTLPHLGLKFSFEKDIMEAEVVEGAFSFCSFNTYFIDIGIPEDYKIAQHDFLQFDHL